MVSNNNYDVLIIGVGMAGVSVAHKAARADKRVAVVDSRPYGGTCALRGCDPKKVLVGAAESINMFGTAIRNGITVLELKTGIYVHPAATSDIAYML